MKNLENIRLEYNSQERNLHLPEYGRNVQKMVNYLKTIEDRDKRNEQAKAIIKVMDILNPQVHLQENYMQKLWDHLFIISEFDLDVDSPYPIPTEDELFAQPEAIPVEKRPLKASHYGRNTEKFIELIIDMEDGEMKTAAISSLASYMRQQYLIWNKDSVSQETIFSDIERLSDYKIIVPEEVSLGKMYSDNNHYRMNNSYKSRGGNSKRNLNQRKKNRK